jgi:hypothetical protein
MQENPNGRKLGFITHAATYLAVVILLAAVNTLARSEIKWWAIIGLCWGIGVAAHFAVTYLPLTVKKQPLGPMDIVGISAGTIALLAAIFSIGTVGRMPVKETSWSPEIGRIVEGFSRGETLREEKDQAVPGAFREVEIRTVAGSIDVAQGGGDGVQVHSVKTARSERAMEAVDVDIEARGDRLIIREKREGIPMNGSGSVSFTVRIPLSVTSIIANTVSGSIEVSEAGPGIDQDLHTVSGEIRAGLARNLRAGTTSGGIRFASTGDVDARTVSGSIEADIRDIQDGGSISMGTVSGSVELEAFPDFDAEVSLHSLSGKVSCDFPVIASLQKNNTLEGRIGGGSVRVKIGTTSGSITVSRE